MTHALGVSEQGPAVHLYALQRHHSPYHTLDIPFSLGPWRGSGDGALVGGRPFGLTRVRGPFSCAAAPDSRGRVGGGERALAVGPPGASEVRVPWVSWAEGSGAADLLADREGRG